MTDVCALHWPGSVSGDAIAGGRVRWTRDVAADHRATAMTRGQFRCTRETGADHRGAASSCGHSDAEFGQLGPTGYDNHVYRLEWRPFDRGIRRP